MELKNLEAREERKARRTNLLDELPDDVRIAKVSLTFPSGFSRVLFRC
jgi:hypothetical protein